MQIACLCYSFTCVYTSVNTADATFVAEPDGWKDEDVCDVSQKELNDAR